MCDERACRDTCLKIGTFGQVTGTVVAATVAVPVLRQAAPAIETAALAVAVVVAGLVGAAVALAVLRWRRGRPVASRRVVRGVAWRSAAPAAGVPLAIASGTPLFVPVVALAGLVIVATVTRGAARMPLVRYGPGIMPQRSRAQILAAQRPELAAAAPLALAPGTVRGTVLQDVKEA